MDAAVEPSGEKVIFQFYMCKKHRCVSRESHSLTTGGNLIILSSGRLYYKKHHYDLIQAMGTRSTDEL